MLFFDINENDGKKAEGRLVITDGTTYKEFPAISGPYGKGHMPKGVYKTTSCYFMKDDGSVDAYKKEGEPWVAVLEPQFETDRTGLLIHPDGNVEGSLGCCALTSGDLEAKSLITELLKNNKELILVVA